MKISRVLLGWMALSTTTITAQSNQTSLSKRVLRFTDPTSYQAASNPGKTEYQPKEFDSVRIEFTRPIDRKRKSVEVLIEYIGPFKNKLFHGLGKIKLTEYGYPFTKERPGVFIYAGNFEQGIAEGAGFMQLNWSYQPYPGKQV